MNFILQDNIDFYNELNNIDSDNEDDENNCLLTKLPLDKNNIKLTCGHAFNFEPLFKEVCNQKCKSATLHLEINKLAYNEIKCPYCRQKHDKLLPHVKLNSEMTYISGVNGPEHLCMEFHICNYVFKGGKNKGNTCTKTAYHYVCGCYCNLHHKNMIKTHATSIKVECKTCIAVLKSGKRKGEVCGVNVRNETSQFCTRHTSK